MCPLQLRVRIAKPVGRDTGAGGQKEKGRRKAKAGFFFRVWYFGEIQSERDMHDVYQLHQRATPSLLVDAQGYC